MTNQVPFQANNAEFNSLYVKMLARFSCGDKTIGEAMLERAEKYEATARRTVPAEVHMKKANSLPKKAKEKNGKRLFSLGSLVAFCMVLLVVGTLLFSGAFFNQMAVGFVADAAPVMEDAGLDSTDILTVPVEELPAVDALCLKSTHLL
ncbi:MAG: hypothetical protein IJY71_05155 [Clostridia bacterium]|nr:hypothetical protein [Clostridia bacterium]